jgi:hypothetical protein
LQAAERKSAFAGTKFIFSKWPKSRREFAGSRLYERPHRGSKSRSVFMSVRLRAAICGAAMICGSLSAMAQSGIASVYAYSGGKPPPAKKLIRAGSRRRIARFHSGRR